MKGDGEARDNSRDMLIHDMGLPTCQGVDKVGEEQLRHCQGRLTDQSGPI